MPRGAPWVAAAFVALLVTARFHGSPHPEPGSSALSLIPVATPPGITLQLRTSGERSRVATAAQLLYADSRGMSLYTYDEDRLGASACAGECADAWPAALAPPTAKSDGDWSLLTQADGTQQWVHRGAPLYRFGNDKSIGDATGDGADRGAWHVAAFNPGAGMALPDGIAVHEIADAGGAGLVDSSGLTLYAFDGDAMHPRPACGLGDCLRLWVPLEAAEIAGPTGIFSVIARDDGVTQWAYRGKPLYKFAGDREPGDVNGMGVDDRFRVALVARFFMPADATIRRTVELGDILTTIGGATLYQRDLVTSAERHEFRTDHGTPALGRSFGTSTCGEKCTKTWPPFVAPADALPCGFWDIDTRANGARQWVYKGFALYTYAADKRTGDASGNAIYDLERIGDYEKHASAGEPAVTDVDRIVPSGGTAPGIGVGAMFWHAVVP